MKSTTRRERQRSAPTIYEIVSGNIKDSNEKICPPKTGSTLKETGADSISFKRSKIDWETIEQDAKVLLKELGVVSRQK